MSKKPPKKPPGQVTSPKDYEMVLPQSRPQTRSVSSKTINLSSPSWAALLEKADEETQLDQVQAQSESMDSLDLTTLNELVKLNPNLKNTEPFKSLLKGKQKAQSSSQSKALAFQKPKPITPAQLQSKSLTQASQKQLAKTVSGPSAVKSKYFTKQDNLMTICTLEPEYDCSLEPNVVAQAIFPADHWGVPSDLSKTQRFFELILVETKSVELKHYFNKDDSKSVAYSTCKICRVMTPTDFGGITKIRQFSVKFSPQNFTYWDYQQAWYRMFFFQNKSFSHSWMIFFKKDSKINLPIWFSNWWQFFGAIPEILPPDVQEGYNFFVSKFAPKPADRVFSKPCLFFLKFSLAWIIKWEFCFQANSPPFPANLARVFKTKWWDTFNASAASLTNVKIFLNKPLETRQSNVLEDNSPIHLASRKAAIQTRLSKATSEADLLQIMSQLKKELSPKESLKEASPQSSSASVNNEEDYAEDNEDTLGLTESQYRLLAEHDLL